MVWFTVLLNSIVTFILPVGLLLLSREPGNVVLAGVYLFFIILGPGVAAPFHKLTFLASNTREIDEGVSRLDAIFEENQCRNPSYRNHPISTISALSMSVSRTKTPRKPHVQKH